MSSASFRDAYDPVVIEVVIKVNGIKKQYNGPHPPLSRNELREAAVEAMSHTSSFTASEHDDAMLHLTILSSATISNSAELHPAIRSKLMSGPT